jgi:preprotein translocase subunit SecG
MHTLLTVIHITVSVFLCLVILLQSGRGGGMGAALGGASSQIFGGRGAGNFLSRMTSVAAVIFFVTSLSLSMMSSRQHSVVAGAHKSAEETAKPADAAPAAQGGVTPAPQPAPEAPKAGEPAPAPAPAEAPKK